MASCNDIIPAKNLMTPNDVYQEFDNIINLYRGRMKAFINGKLMSLSPVSLVNRHTCIMIDTLIEHAIKQHCITDKYKYKDMLDLFVHVKTVKNIHEHNLIDYILTPITTELHKLNYDVTIRYPSSSIMGNGAELPVNIALKWNHMTP